MLLLSVLAHSSTLATHNPCNFGTDRESSALFWPLQELAHKHTETYMNLKVLIIEIYIIL